MERQVRQLLADKVSGNLVGVWLLFPDHLRLGTWDLLCSWAGGSPQSIQPRLALQLVHESALCTCNLRTGRTLSQKGFALAHTILCLDEQKKDLPPLVLADEEHYALET